MNRLVQRIKSVTKKSADSIKHEGVKGFANRSMRFVYYRQFPERKKKLYRDILFINGSTLPHPTRYRVDHQIEQLESSGLTADSVFYEQLTPDMLKCYRGFVFFRCPITDTIREFIKQAKASNKACFFDIDDLVIDQKYTDQIKYVQGMSAAERELYDSGVNRMHETLSLCDVAVTTTEGLQRELQSYTKEVFINRNVASDEMVRHSLAALKHIRKDSDTVTLGYFSGSITHNEDFESILPALIELFETYDNVRLTVAGILDIPRELEPYRNRISAVGFMDWRTMPAAIAACDINLAPLTDSIFNEAKSENKWLEAALVKVVTVASNLGAFKEIVEHGKTGVLVDDAEGWFDALRHLINNPGERGKIAETAHKKALIEHTTVYTGQRIANFLRSKLARNIAFVLPSTDISGGVNVALKHADILRKNGWDVTLIDAIDRRALKLSQKQYEYRLDLPGYNVITDFKTDTRAYFDSMVATLWATVDYIKKYPNVSNRVYLVQNYETDFYVWGTGKPKFMANATYSDDTNLRYATISLWCREWLKTRYGKDARYASNGIDLAYYQPRTRNFEGKIHILIEGDSRSEYKNTDEAFRIVEKLDPKKYEISYLSYRKEPKDWYRVDHFYNRIAPEKVGEVYAKCDILIKTSLVESFSYPPLEMMATGGVSVVVPNGGNVEYLRDGENCLFYEQGNIEAGVAAVQRLVDGDKAFRDKLIKQGLKTAQKYSWDHIEDDIVALYK